MDDLPVHVLLVRDEARVRTQREAVLSSSLSEVRTEGGHAHADALLEYLCLGQLAAFPLCAEVPSARAALVEFKKRA